MTDIAKLYDDRVNRMVAAATLGSPDRVPVFGNIDTWAIYYGNTTISECLANVDLMKTTYGKAFTDFNFDGAFMTNTPVPLELIQFVGGSYFESSDGITLQQKEECQMIAEDYDELIANPITYTWDTLIPRLTDNMSGTEEEKKNFIRKAIQLLFAFGKFEEECKRYFKEDIGMPMYRGNNSTMPIDFIFDFFRGFESTLMDMRRHPDKIGPAAEALKKWTINKATGLKPAIGSFPFVNIPLHAPPFMSNKQFEKFYWPTFRDVLLAIHESKGTVQIVLEASWKRYWDYLKELPKGFMILAIEDDDIVEAKKFFEGHACVAGGLQLSKLGYGTKKECIDDIKRVIDECAPGGGFILSTNKTMQSPIDAKPENLKAVVDFAQEYGKY
ncbi:MAG: uroporphyrinogen decarboxylase family protein [Eubacteriaceae bacterium]